MQLQSARDLKLKLVDKYSLYRGGVRGGPRYFALGVAPGARPVDFQLAVRAESEADVPPETKDEIVKEADGEVDIQYVGRIEALAGAVPSSLRGPAIGASVGHGLCSAGTLGFFARRNEDESIGFVSNNHVIAACDEGKDFDDVLHPGPKDGGIQPRDVIGHLAGDYPLLKDPQPRVDCAFATLIEGQTFDPGALYLGHRLSATTVEPYNLPEVSKIGRTTDLTHGRVSAFDLDPFVHYEFGKIRFDGQIEIEPGNGKPFSMGGDSGSLVFTTDGFEPVGLLFAGSILGGPSKFGRAYANPIDAVLKALNVTMLT